MRSSTLFIVAAWRATAQEDPTTTNTANDASITPASTSAYNLACTTHIVSRTGRNDVIGSDCSFMSEEPQSAAEDCTTTSWASEADAEAAEFQAELCSNVGQPTKSRARRGNPYANDGADPYANDGHKATNMGLPHSFVVPYTSTAASPSSSTATSTASAIASAIPSENAAVSVDTVALWQPALGLIVGYLIFLA